MNEDEQLQILLEERSTRGAHRGADAVWISAADEVADTAAPGGPQRWLAVAAAVLVAVAGGWWMLERLADDRSMVEAVDSSPTEESTGEVASTTATTTPTAVNSTSAVNSTAAQSSTVPTATPTSASERPPGADSEEQVPLGMYGSIEGVTQTSSGDDGWLDELTPGSEPGNNGGALRRLVEPVAFVDGDLTIDVDYAAVVADRGTTAWGEVVVTPAASPNPNPAAGAFYAAEQFTGEAVVGCRLQGDQQVVCQLIDEAGERVWQLSWFEAVGRQQPTDPEAAQWRACDATSALEDCMLRFTLILAETELTVLVDGAVHVHQTDLPPLPASLTGGPVYVHLASGLSRHEQPVASFDWGAVGVLGRN